MSNGGPAFPTKGGMMFFIPQDVEADVKGEIERVVDLEHRGISKLEYFAIQIVCAGISSPKFNEGLLKREMAHEAFEMAAIMLEESERRNAQG